MKLRTIEEYNVTAQEFNRAARQAAVNQPDDFYRLNARDQAVLKNWISTKLNRIKTVNRRHTSYGLKHYFTNDGNFYITNGMFKGAVIELGFKIADESKLNWNINVSERSITSLERRGIQDI